MRSAYALFLWGCSLTLVGGCQAPPQANGPTRAIVRVSDRDAFLDSMMTVLREHDFPPDQLDRRGGTLVTEPSTSGQWFEIWRSDVHGAYQILESSLHTLRRIVTVHVSPSVADGEDAYDLVVEVDKQRLSAAERQITTSSGLLSIYSERVPTIEGKRGAGSALVRWIDAGRDVLLENYLLGRFAEAAALVRRIEPERPTPPAPAPAQPAQPRRSTPGTMEMQAVSG